MRVFLPSDGLASGHSPAKPCGFPVLCTPAQVAQGWLRTQPDSGPSQLLAFMRFLRAQSQFSTGGGERGSKNPSVTSLPLPKRRPPRAHKGSWLILNIWEGGSFQGSHGSTKRPKPQGQERCCGLNCIPLNSYVEVLILSVLVFGDGHPKLWPIPSPLS